MNGKDLDELNIRHCLDWDEYLVSPREYNQHPELYEKANPAALVLYYGGRIELLYLRDIDGGDDSIDVFRFVWVVMDAGRQSGFPVSEAEYDYDVHQVLRTYLSIAYQDENDLWLYVTYPEHEIPKGLPQRHKILRKTYFVVFKRR